MKIIEIPAQGGFTRRNLRWLLLLPFLYCSIVLAHTISENHASKYGVINFAVLFVALVSVEFSILRLLARFEVWGLPQRAMDERQIVFFQRNYQTSYKILGGLVPVALVYAALASYFGYWLPKATQDWAILFIWFFNAITLFPVLVSAWREVTALEEDEDSPQKLTIVQRRLMRIFVLTLLCGVFIGYLSANWPRLAQKTHHDILIHNQTKRRNESNWIMKMKRKPEASADTRFRSARRIIIGLAVFDCAMLWAWRQGPLPLWLFPLWRGLHYATITTTMSWALSPYVFGPSFRNKYTKPEDERERAIIIQSFAHAYVVLAALFIFITVFYLPTAIAAPKRLWLPRSDSDVSALMVFTVFLVIGLPIFMAKWPKPVPADVEDDA